MKELKNIKVLEFNVPNKNGRIYSEDCIDLDDPIIKEKLANKAFFGQIGFPSSEDNGCIDIFNISHVVTNLEKQQDGLYADITILDTPQGKLLAEIVNPNNFRTAGSGTLTHKSLYENIDGIYTVENYTLESINYTDDPA